MMKFKHQDMNYAPMRHVAGLVAQYLSVKYQANIIPCYDDARNFRRIANLLSDSREKTRALKHYREAIFLSGGSGLNEIHAVFMVYIKEGGKEGVLFSDSLGSQQSIAEGMCQAAGIDVFYTPDIRQADPSSCYVDALVFGRDTTGKRATGEYIIPNLLSVLTDRSEKVEFRHGPETNGVYSVKLPNALLKTSQTSKFFEAHLDEDTKHQKIHKDESIEKSWFSIGC